MRYLVVLSTVLGAVLLFLLSKASANTPLFAQDYPLLLGLGGVLAVSLLLLIAYQLWHLKRRIRARVFGAKLTLRILLMFSVMALLPGAIVYGISVQFLTRSIDSWFNVRVDNALYSGLSLGQTALDNLRVDLAKKATSMAFSLADQPAARRLYTLDRLREQMGVQEAALFDQDGHVVAFSGGEGAPSLAPNPPDPSILQQVRQQRPYSALESSPDKGLFLRAVVPVDVLSLTEDMLVLELIQPVPTRLAHDADAVQSVYRAYEELSVARLGLKRLYGLTLTLTLLLALFSAMALAFLLSERLSAPLGLLAEGTRAVAKGDFTLMHPVQTRDELGALMQSFNSMTRQLADAREAAEVNQQQVEMAKAYLESVLANLSSGVLAFDEHLYLRTMNPVAIEILGVGAAATQGLRLFEWGGPGTGLSEFAMRVSQEFLEHGERPWQRQIEFARGPATRVLLARGTRFSAGSDSGYVLVFDDVTDLLQAQRDAAWGEVARRLAHEIKNPLTPIQLSAERLEHKLADKLSPGDGEMLARATRTIVAQVNAMKNMVDAFKNYARAPSVNAAALDLNALVREVAVLYESTGDAMRLDLSDRLPPVRGDVTLLRQVIHNLLQNAQDATSAQPRPRVLVHTEASGPWVKLIVSDNGSGVPEHIKGRIFEPYVTTKSKGTGLGLAVVKKIVEEHQGMVHIEDLQPTGTAVCIALPRMEHPA
ncbi:MAG: ATP-binding protein [Betaproteobacteria bacterium]|nr:ATP-binding protein [Betaproteobacteria bacterium]